MVKQFILLIQLIGVFFYQLVLTGDVTISQNIPATIQPETEVVVEVKVNKSDASGFAKVQQDIPEGFSAEALETKGATFSFKENRVKFIWMALPSEEEFTITYKLKPLAGTTGDFSIGGKFSFIADSERQNVVIPTANFKVSEDAIVADVVTEEDPVDEDATGEETIDEEVAQVEVTANRKIEKTGEGKYKVTLAINKKGIEGFAKVSEQIPMGFKATEDNSNGGVFSYKEGVAKVLWMATPKGEIILTYNLETTTAEDGNYNITGDFAYLEDDVTQKKIIDKSEFEHTGAIVEEEILAVEETPETEVIEDDPVVEPVVEDDPIVENTSTNREADITSVPAPETAVAYKVQVGAGHQTVAANYFAAKFSLQDNVSTENHEGWIKYLVGSFTEYKAARDKRNKVRNNVKTAFVTAYNSGQRITVQEALMISNQKWYK